MSEKEYSIGDEINVAVPESFQPYVKNLAEVKGQISEIVEIGKKWSIYYFEAEGLDFFLEDILEDEEWISYFGVEIDHIKEEKEFLDEDEDYKDTIVVNGESYEFIEDDEDVEYLDVGDDEKGEFEYAEYKHASSNLGLRITYWDENFEAHLFVEVDF